LDLLGLLLQNYEMQDWAGQSFSSIASELCGLITILSGTILLHTAEEGANNSSGSHLAQFAVFTYVCNSSLAKYIMLC